MQYRKYSEDKTIQKKRLDEKSLKIEEKKRKEEERQWENSRLAITWRSWLWWNWRHCSWIHFWFVTLHHASHSISHKHVDSLHPESNITSLTTWLTDWLTDRLTNGLIDCNSHLILSQLVSSYLFSDSPKNFSAFLIDRLSGGEIALSRNSYGSPKSRARICRMSSSRLSRNISGTVCAANFME